MPDIYTQIKNILKPDEEQKKRNEKNAFPSIYNSKHFVRGLGFAVAYGSGAGTLVQTVAIAAGTASTLTAGASLIGLPIMMPGWVFLTKGLRELMSQQSSLLRMPVMFLFHASMAALSAFIGLAIIAACTSALWNPFVLPCFIAIAVASTIVLSATIAVAFRTRYITPENDPVSKNLLKHMAHAAFNIIDTRPLGYEDNITCNSNLVVVPFGKKEPIIPHNNKVHSIGNFLSSLFVKKNVHEANEATVTTSELEAIKA